MVWEPAPALAWLEEYTASAFRKIRAVAPPGQILRPDAGPRITLPGPALPPHLDSLTGAGISRIHSSQRAQAKSPRGWMGSLLAVTALLSAGVSGVFYAMPHGGGASKAAPPEEVQAATSPASASYSLSKSVEVTGFRFLDDDAKHSEVHYLVVNHSGTNLSDMTIFVTVSSSGAKAGQPPLCRFAFRTPNLAAYEAKEMISTIDKLPRAVSLQDWQDLRVQLDLAQ